MTSASQGICAKLSYAANTNNKNYDATVATTAIAINACFASEIAIRIM